MRIFCLAMLLTSALSAQSGSHHWSVTYEGNHLDVYGRVKNNLVFVNLQTSKTGPPPLSVAVNVFPPGYTPNRSYLALGMKQVDPDHYQGLGEFSPGLSHIEVTVFFTQPGSIRASTNAGCVLLKGWTVKR